MGWMAVAPVSLLVTGPRGSVPSSRPTLHPEGPVFLLYTLAETVLLAEFMAREGASPRRAPRGLPRQEELGAPGSHRALWKQLPAPPQAGVGARAHSEQPGLALLRHEVPGVLRAVLPSARARFPERLRPSQRYSGWELREQNPPLLELSLGRGSAGTGLGEGQRGGQDSSVSWGRFPVSPNQRAEGRRRWPGSGRACAKALRWGGPGSGGPAGP